MNRRGFLRSLAAAALAGYLRVVPDFAHFVRPSSVVVEFALFDGPTVEGFGRFVSVSKVAVSNVTSGQALQAGIAPEWVEAYQR